MSTSEFSVLRLVGAGSSAENAGFVPGLSPAGAAWLSRRGVARPVWLGFLSPKCLFIFFSSCPSNQRELQAGQTSISSSPSSPSGKRCRTSAMFSEQKGQATPAGLSPSLIADCHRLFTTTGLSVWHRALMVTLLPSQSWHSQIFPRALSVHPRLVRHLGQQGVTSVSITLTVRVVGAPTHPNYI